MVTPSSLKTLLPDPTSDLTSICTIAVMRTFYRIIAVVVVGAVLFVGVGPLLPAGNPVKEAADAFLGALNAWWGFPLGLPGT